MFSLAMSKEAGGISPQLSRSHSQLAVTMSKSELKRLIPTTPGGVQSEHASLSPQNEKD